MFHVCELWIYSTKLSLSLSCICRGPIAYKASLEWRSQEADPVFVSKCCLLSTSIFFFICLLSWFFFTFIFTNSIFPFEDFPILHTWSLHLSSHLSTKCCPQCSQLWSFSSQIRCATWTMHLQGCALSIKVHLIKKILNFTGLRREWDGAGRGVWKTLHEPAFNDVPVNARGLRMRPPVAEVTPRCHAIPQFIAARDSINLNGCKR